MIRLAIVGTGNIAKTHAQAIEELDNCELVALVNHRLKSMALFGQEFDVSRQYMSITDLLDAGHVDAVIICTPNALHAKQTILALQAGVHVLVEKPMAMNAEESQQMLDISRETETILQVAHCWRFDDEVQYVRDQIVSGAIGDIIRTKGYSTHVNWGPQGWFTQKELAGGGALADMGIHAVDTVRFLLGDPIPKSVYANIGTHYGDYDVDDTGVITINWTDGSSSLIEFGWWQPQSDGIAASTQFYGTQGFAKLFPTTIEQLNMGTHQLEAIDIPYPAIREPHVPLSIYVNQIEHFIDCIENEAHPIADGKVGIVNMQIIDAAYESSRIGQVITIDN